VIATNRIRYGTTTVSSNGTEYVPTLLVDALPHRVCYPASGFQFTDDTKDNFGRITSQVGHRVIELALKYYF